MEKAEIQAFIDFLGITYKAEFVPFSKSRNAKEKQLSLNWIITLSKGNMSLTTDYMQGIGHLKNYSHAQSKLLWYSENVQHAVETGTWYDKLTYETQYSNIVKSKFWKPIPHPELIDVLYSLALDADAIDYPTFEDWANTFGYSTDSRNAEKIYRACLETALKLRAMIGDTALEKLREAYQDY